MKLKDDETPSSPDSYENNELVTYDKAKKSTKQNPYIAAIITSKDEDMFILGDGKNTSNPTLRLRATATDYYNGPLEPGSSYSIFQRIFINEKVTLYNVQGRTLGVCVCVCGGGGGEKFGGSKNSVQKPSWKDKSQFG